MTDYDTSETVLELTLQQIEHAHTLGRVAEISEGLFAMVSELRTVTAAMRAEPDDVIDGRQILLPDDFAAQLGRDLHDALALRTSTIGIARDDTLWPELVQFIHLRIATRNPPSPR